jgi:hypothetical protein
VPFPPRLLLQPLLILAALTPRAHAIVLRTPDFASQVRLAWMPDLHEENTAFPIPIERLRGIAWPDPSTSIEWTRQMTLISPIHFVFATHYPIDPSWLLSFQLADGTLAKRGIASLVPLKNANGENTDILIGTLQTPVTFEETGIRPFPVANLANDAAYLGQRVWTFGKVATAGRGTEAGFSTLTDPGFNTTRFIYFDYLPDGSPGTQDDDGHFEGGDSGSPTFIVENGQPELLGTHSYIYNDGSGGVRSYDSFIPGYLPEMDAAMEAQGYHMIRSHPVATTVSISTAPAATFVPGQAGSVTFTPSNTGDAEADNLTLTVRFSRPPAALTGTGWFCEETAPGTWACHKAGLLHGTAAPLTASWTNIGDDGTMKISGSFLWDGGTAEPVDRILPVGNSYYADWVGTLDRSTPTEDPDGDELPNLLEYAFDGDPANPSTAAIPGFPLLPLIVDGAFRFPKRTDAAQRGLIYHLETSTDLTTWTETLPDGVSAAETPFDPPVSGFVDEVVAFPREGRHYFRVRLELTP